MKKYRFLRFPEGKLKAVTFSYDDGTRSDLRLAGRLQHYNLRCTFNLSSSWLSQENHLTPEEIEKERDGNAGDGVQGIGSALGSGSAGTDFTEEVVGNLTMKEAMKQLKPSEQEILDLKILGGFTFQEIAAILKKPMGTVSWLYRQGIGKLRKYLEEMEVQE